jgi:hypothetical protein
MENPNGRAQRGVRVFVLKKIRHPELVESCPLGTGKIESPKAIPQGEGSRERTESTISLRQPYKFQREDMKQMKNMKKNQSVFNFMSFIPFLFSCFAPSVIRSPVKCDSSRQRRAICTDSSVLPILIVILSNT